MSDSTPAWINDGTHNLDIAKFVTEGDDFVERIVSRAVNELRRTTRYQHLTFAAVLTEGTPEALRAAVEAVYLHLSDDYHLNYEFERAFDYARGEQQVRLPRMTGKANRGTCMDLVILFLSCLANAKLQPIYVHLRGSVNHCVAATWLQQLPPQRDTFLTIADLRRNLRDGKILLIECTGFAEGYPLRPHKISFEEACDQARQLLEKIPDSEFGFAVDVRKAWETGVRPLEFGFVSDDERVLSTKDGSFGEEPRRRRKRVTIWKSVFAGALVLIAVAAIIGPLIPFLRNHGASNNGPISVEAVDVRYRTDSPNEPQEIGRGARLALGDTVAIKYQANVRHYCYLWLYDDTKWVRVEPPPGAVPSLLYGNREVIVPHSPDRRIRPSKPGPLDIVMLLVPKQLPDDFNIVPYLEQKAGGITSRSAKPVTIAGHGQEAIQGIRYWPNLYVREEPEHEQ